MIKKANIMSIFFTNKKGFSLLEVVISLGIVGINALAFMHLQSQFVQSNSQSKVLSSISEVEKVIEKTLKDDASCSVNLKDKKEGDEFSDLKLGVVDPNNSENYVSLNKLALENDLGNGVSIEKYMIVTKGNYDYLEVSFALSENKKKLGVNNLKKRFLINTIKGASGTIESCSGEVADKRKLAATFTCESNRAVLNPVTGECDLEDKLIDPPSSEECGKGATYRLTYEDGKIQTKCKPCTHIKKFVRSSCEKKYEGMNWVNVCYYRSACEEDSISSFGVEYFSVGPTKASGADTGTKNNCESKRLPCDGEKISFTYAESTAVAEAKTANDNKKYAEEQSRLILKYYQEGNLDEAYEYFSYLKLAVDNAANSAARAKSAAQLANTTDAIEAAKAAQKAEEETKKYFKDSFVIFSNAINKK